MHANGVAGLQAVQSVNGRIENIDITDIVSGKNELLYINLGLEYNFVQKLN